MAGIVGPTWPTKRGSRRDIRTTVKEFRERIKPEIYKANKELFDRAIFSQPDDAFVIGDKGDLINMPSAPKMKTLMRKSKTELIGLAVENFYKAQERQKYATTGYLPGDEDNVVANLEVLPKKIIAQTVRRGAF